MIIDQLARICHEIRMIESQCELPSNCNDEELKASAILLKNQREENLAKTLYYTLKKYALGQNNDCLHGHSSHR